jgi:hypothetical protein
MTDSSKKMNLARETNPSGVGHCRDCKKEFEKLSWRFKCCPECRKEKKRAGDRKKYLQKKKPSKCNNCGVEIAKEPGQIRARSLCLNCRVRKPRRNIKLICQTCDKQWTLISTTKTSNFPPCYDCRNKPKTNQRIFGQVPRQCKICNIEMMPPGCICRKCKYLSRKSIIIFSNIRKEQIMEFHQFMTRIESRGGMASKEEIFIDLIGWAGVFLSVERYNGSINNQIEKMWKDLIKIWVGIKQHL